MSSILTSISCCRVWQLVNACLVVAVCSYVFFDLLDLDGSKFPSQRDSTCSYAAVPENATEKRSDDFRSMANVIGEILPSSAYERMGASQFQTKELDSLALASERHRSYRVALPRSSTADPDLPA